jgi:hypothetical protein
MQQGIQHPEPVPPTEPTTSRLRTVIGNRFPRKCACGFAIRSEPQDEVGVEFLNTDVTRNGPATWGEKLTSRCTGRATLEQLHSD